MQSGNNWETLSTELIANHLYAPSYVSMSSALRYYGLIPEEVYTKQSMTLKYAKNFDTPFGRFEYTHISKSAFSVGMTSIKKDGYAFVMATPEKALCDLIANSSKVNLRYLKDAEIYLEEDIRMEREDFMQMDARLFEEYIEVGKKADSIRTLLKPKSVIRHAESVFDWESEAFGHLARLCPHPDSST